MSQGGLLIVGAGGHGRVVLDCARVTGHWSEFAFADDGIQRGAVVDGVQVLGPLREVSSLDVARFGAVIVALGDAGARERAHAEAVGLGLVLERLMHPSAVVARTARIGAGAVILAGALVGPGVSMGEGVVVNCGAVVDHDAVIEDFAHVAVSAVVGARARVCRRETVSMGSVRAQDAYR